MDLNVGCNPICKNFDVTKGCGEEEVESGEQKQRIKWEVLRDSEKKED